MANPAAYVRSLENISADPNNPNQTVFDITVDLFNYGPLAQQVQLSVPVPNGAPKPQVNMLINQAIVADAAVRGVSINERSIWTLGDVAG